MAGPATEARHPRSEGLHALPGEIALSHVLDAQIAALAAARPAAPAIARAAEAAAKALRSGGKLAYVGAGSSGLMALADCLELPGTFGISPDRVPMLFAGGAASLLHMVGSVEDDRALGAADFHGAEIAAGDVVLCLSASGTTPYTLAVAERARLAQATVVGIANDPGSALLTLADIAILLDTGPEIVGGSTRLGAAAAQKAALNMLSVLVGIRLGHVHDGYMVNLVADNAKLIDRAARIVSAITGRAMTEATKALALGGGDVKTGALIATGATPEQARELLEASGGHLGPALETLAKKNHPTSQREAS